MLRHALIQLIAGLFLMVTSNLHASTLAHFWSNGYGGTSNESSDRAVAVDAAGNVYVSGGFNGTVDFGGGSLVSAGGTDIFLAKYAPDGSHVWSFGIGGTSTDYMTWLDLDASGNIYVTGSFSGAVDFGGGGLVSAGLDDIFLAKYDGATGAHIWSQRFGSTNGDRAEALVVDGAGNVLLTGRFQLTVDFGGGGLVSAGGEDMFLAKYDATGAHQWSQRFGSTAQDFAIGIASDGSNAFITGYYNLTVDFGGGGLVSAGGTDIFLAKYDAAGAHQWSRRMGGPDFDYGDAVAIDGSGNPVVTGEYSSGADLGGGVLPNSGLTDFFLAKYDGATGGHMWSHGYGGTGWDGGWDLSVDSSDNLFVGGWMSSTVDFGGGPLTSAGSDDGWLAKYDKDGNHVWSSLLGGTSIDYTGGLVVDGSDNVIATIRFGSTVDFGGGGLTSAGGNDIALVKYAGDAAEPLITSIEDIGNDQGRQVKIRFDRSGYDQAEAPETIVRYDAFRRDDAPPASSATSEQMPRGMSTGQLLAEGWTQVGSVNAFGDPSYGIDVPTIGDSTIASGQYFSTFFIRAATPTPTTYFESNPDSGYSLDNLEPSVPSLLVYNAGLLEWADPTDADFDYFSVYGSNTDDFGAATFVNYSTAASLDVTGSPYTYYYVTATDFSGNESAPGGIYTLTGVGGTPERYVLSVSSYPNPFNPATTVKYTVPQAGVVTVAIYDARGARVATLVSGEHEAGAYDAPWNGHSDSGTAVSSGVYFARIDHNGAVRSKKLVLLK